MSAHPPALPQQRLTVPAPDKPKSPFYTGEHAGIEARTRRNVGDMLAKLLDLRKAALADAPGAKERAFASAYVDLLQLQVLHQRQMERAYAALATGDVGEATKLGHGGATPIRYEGAAKR